MLAHWIECAMKPTMKRQTGEEEMKTVTCKTWKEFRDFIDSDPPAGRFYWRGQRDPAWPLASSFERRILAWDGKGSQIYPYDHRYNFPLGGINFTEGFITAMRNRYLEHFKKAASGLRGPNPKDLSDDQWWALGRHYGLITPLLDWTEKPYIAVYFALADLYTLTRINPGVGTTPAEIAIYKLQPFEGDGLHIVKVTLDELGTIHSQRALFTWLKSTKYFELQGFLEDTGRGDLLTRILLSRDAFHDAYLDLDAHGIDYRLLFPDLGGAARAANTIAVVLESGAFGDLGYAP
jgi:hypothetical protein